jgi:hypothetical protein
MAGAPIESGPPSWLVDLALGVGGGTITAIGFVWHAATTVAGMKKDIEEQGAKIEKLDADIQARSAKQDDRHTENQKAIADLHTMLARQPDKEDFRRLSDWLRAELSGIRQNMRGP